MSLCILLLALYQRGLRYHRLFFLNPRHLFHLLIVSIFTPNFCAVLLQTAHGFIGSKCPDLLTRHIIMVRRFLGAFVRTTISACIPPPFFLKRAELNAHISGVPVLLIPMAATLNLHVDLMAFLISRDVILDTLNVFFVRFHCFIEPFALPCVLVPAKHTIT